MRLKELREELNISQKELAEKLNISPTNVYNYENGRTEPSISMLVSIANVLDVSLDYLLERSNENETHENDNLGSVNSVKELLVYFNKLNVADKNKVIGYACALSEK